MATWMPRVWEPSFDAPSRRGRRAGKYLAYVPDPLVSRPLVLSAELGGRAFDVESSLRELSGTSTMATCLEGLARFLLRSEAMASSRIEGLQVSAQQVALAELAQTDESVTRGFTANAQLVANNITAVRQAATALAASRAVTVSDVDGLHQALLPEEKHHGVRTVQNWIGGDDWHPIDADFVPPPPECVADLMDDLCAYLNGGLHAPLVQAALVHAQFETIHPYTDGNGRVGRALIHTVLVRRGLTPSALLPISLVLLTRSQEYLAGLTAFRHDGPAAGADAQEAVAAWLSMFLDAAAVAVDQAKQLGEAVAELTGEWTERVAVHRYRSGIRGVPRAGSATARLLELLPELPVLTARTVQRTLGVSFPQARQALEGLADAGVLYRKDVDRGTTGYLAREVFDLLTFTERRLASTRWDTREATPSRPVPRRPEPKP
ncbi:Fic family protein [Kibdelosporangium lantanae]|uniref:Fic family protein n=1 Tax=Kibdelosporangium lantanae TaxID=1497396 RepID=A0ABW3M4I3_9PSEU